jgi:hypothetical protein
MGSPAKAELAIATASSNASKFLINVPSFIVGHVRAAAGGGYNTLVPRQY